jgi:hypothetical protein
LDADGVPNGLDNCPNDPNPDQRDSDGDGIGDACDTMTVIIDFDGDSVPDLLDNCPGTPNPDQADSDMDGVGDACDKDVDQDKFPDGLDNCPNVANPDQLDTNQNGVGDACEPTRTARMDSSCGCRLFGYGGTSGAAPAMAGAVGLLAAWLRRRRTKARTA